MLILALAVVVLSRWWSPWPAAPPQQPETEIYQLQRVVDGDTIVLAGPGKVRLIGVDTPETVKPHHPVEPWGPEAAQFTREFLSGAAVRLGFDHERTDQYGRTLAYVWVGDRMLNEELVRAGLARVETQYHYSAAMKDRFLAAQAEAQAARRGIWSQAGDGTCDTAVRPVEFTFLQSFEPVGNQS